MPDHADAPVAGRAAGRPRQISSFALGQARPQLGCPQRLLNCHAHRVKLVVGRDLLDQPAAAVVFKDDEIADEFQEALRGE